MLHIPDEENIELNYGIAQTLNELPSEYNAADYPTRASIKSLLASVHAPAVEYLSKLRDEDLGRSSPRCGDSAATRRMAKYVKDE